MAPGNSSMSGNTCGCRMSWTYRWAIMVPRINTRGDRVLYRQWYPIPSQQLWERCVAVKQRQDRGVHHRVSPHEHDYHQC
ncbi:uncharacterized protein TNCV_1003131 [Trichonephila clavipes]|nr:uncharacterized protein TNCV_1003131 [Trichonephila clavipes]